jgi:hypothetical protein
MAPKLPDQIQRMMAAREWRMHHFLWHEVRNGWLSFEAATQQQIRDLGWEPPRPARTKADQNGQSQPVLDNNSGEDFLYMHRQMIGAVNTELLRIGDPLYPNVKGWSPLPGPKDTGYPVPPDWQTGNPNLDSYLKSVKSDATFTTSFLPWQSDYTSPDKLSAWSLGELGSRIEFTIHNQMHMRWCSEPVQTGIRPDVDVAHPESIDAKWDDVNYDWLGDTYSSHVNSIFWRIHGWVDDRIEDWKRANKVVGEIAWKGKWVGKSPAQPDPHSFLAAFSAQVGHDHHGGTHGNLSEMEKAVALIARRGRFCHFYDDINLPR